MRALPFPPQTQPVPTALSCPDCPGVLEVSLLGRRYLEFRCRIGHRYTLGELFTAKERRLEEGLWACVTALEELVALLEDEPGLPGSSVADGAARRQRAQEAIQALHRVIQDNEPVDLDGGADAAPEGSTR